MNRLTCSLVVYLWLAILIGCASETRVITPVGDERPTRQAASTPAPAQPALVYSNQLSPALKMNVKRATHTATLLADGRVLIVGGFREEGTSEVPIASAEIYDPQRNTFTPTADLNEARSGATATLLRDGKVLIVGGWGPSSRSTTAELYDPQTGKFSYTGRMLGPRASMTATLLKNGTVLIAGGEAARNSPQLIAEIYDPATNTFTQTGSLNIGRSAHTATLLDDGHVLVAGGSSGDDRVAASAEIYDPVTGKFMFTGSMRAVRYKHAAVRLQDGNVLLIGGSNQNDWTGKYITAEIYDVQTGAFAQVADLNSERFKLADAAVLLKNGNVLVGGGNRQLEIFDPKNGRFVLSQELDNHYYYTVLTLLNNGHVLITGGYDPSIQPTDQAWVYN